MRSFLAEGVDLTSPLSILLAGVVALGATVALLFKLSRTDKDAQLAAKDSALKDAAAREAVHIAERATWVEITLRTTRSLEEITKRLELIERRQGAAT